MRSEHSRVQVPSDEVLAGMAPFAAVAALREIEHEIMLKLGAITATLGEKIGCAAKLFVLAMPERGYVCCSRLQRLGCWRAAKLHTAGPTRWQLSHVECVHARSRSIISLCAAAVVSVEHMCLRKSTPTTRQCAHAPFRGTKVAPARPTSTARAQARKGESHARRQGACALRRRGTEDLAR